MTFYECINNKIPAPGKNRLNKIVKQYGVQMLSGKILAISTISICIISSILFFYNLQSRDFWAPDEGDFAEIVTELKGNLIVPHLNGKPYGEKPPLFYYIVYASKISLPSVKDEASMRVPTALFAFFFIIFTFTTIRKVFDKEAAIVTTFTLMTTPLFYWQARYLQVDMIFACFLAGSLFFFLWYYHTNRAYYLHLFFFCSGLAFMVKGPLSIVLTFPVVFIFLLHEKNLGILRPRTILAGVIIFLLVVLPWYIAIYFSEGLPYLYENVIRQNLTRFFDAWSHKRPFYYYLTTLPLDYFPWSLFLPAGIYIAFTKFKADHRPKFFLIWFLWMFFFLSISSGKISKYMLPLLPSISIITSYALLKKESRYNVVVFSLLSILFLILSALLFFYKTDLYKEFSHERVLIGLSCLIVSVATFFLLRRKKLIYLCFSFFLFMTICYTIANASLYKKMNSYKSPKPMCEKIKSYLEDGTPWIYYGSIRGVYIYYVGKHAIHIDEHKIDELHSMTQKLDKFYILTRKRDMNEVEDSLSHVRIIFEEKVGNTVMVFSYYQRER